jgi:hypothetical protein
MVVLSLVDGLVATPETPSRMTGPSPVLSEEPVDRPRRRRLLRLARAPCRGRRIRQGHEVRADHGEDVGHGPALDAEELEARHRHEADQANPEPGLEGVATGAQERFYSYVLF